MMEEEFLAVCLATQKGVGRKTLYRLLCEAGSIKGIFDMGKKDIISCVGQRYAENIFAVCKEGGKDALERCIELGGEIIRKYEKKGIRCISCISEQFPDRLRQIPDPPFCLYVIGELPKEKMACVAMIGARACSTYGRGVAYSFGKELAGAGVGIISGMARGIDGVAQEGAIAGGGQTYAVLGGGVDYCYPSEHRGLYEAISQKGGVISEYLPGTEPRANFFPERNRIISGMADIVLVIEARKRSGTYITVTQALEQGREVYAVPGRVTDVLSDGCNALIKDGAGVADSAMVILEALRYRGYQIRNNGIGADRERRSPLNCENDGIRGRLIDILDVTPIHINELYRAMNVEGEVIMEEIMTELVHMELDGMVNNCGNYYAKCF